MSRGFTSSGSATDDIPVRIGNSGRPPGPNVQPIRPIAGVGDACSNTRPKCRTGRLRLPRSGNVNPGVDSTSKVPSPTGCARFVTWNAVVTPLNVILACSSPDPRTTEFVPEPEHTMTP